MNRLKAAEVKSLELGLMLDHIIDDAKAPQRKDLIAASIMAYPNKESMPHNCTQTPAVNEILRSNGYNTGQVTIGYLSYNCELEFKCDLESLSSEIDSKSNSGVDLDNIP